MVFKSLRIGWIVTNMSERIESGTESVVNTLILMGLNIKTHDTIFIFTAIYCMVTHNMFGKYLAKRGPDFVTEIEERLRYDEKRWLMKITNVPTDTTTVKGFDLILGTELDKHRDNWIEGYVEERNLNPSANGGLYTSTCIKEYLVRLGHSLHGCPAIHGGMR